MDSSNFLFVDKDNPDGAECNRGAQQRGDIAEAMVSQLTSSEEVVLDPESVQQKLGEAMRQVVDAAVILVRSAPYGLMPDPAHMGVLRHAVKKLDLASAEANVTAALMKLAEEADNAPKDIQTEGV